MQAHCLTLSNREVLEATGVVFVNSFDDREVILDTTHGSLCLRGEELHISQLSLDEGKVVVQGKLAVIEYKSPGKSIKGRGKSLAERILK
ncbi:MAG: sporulation protein YabP [Syntrophomonadaceae bacterium]|jgi:sporulation protein YabP|nr:sporulation protein YabP [Syntrophomonadaceae bacterium]